MSSSPQRIGVFSWLAKLRNETRGSFTLILAFSLVANLLLLVAPLYMLQVYDRVLVSGSTDTLIWLTLLAVFLLSVYGAAEAGRRRVCGLAGAKLEARVSKRVFQRFENAMGPGARLSGQLHTVARVQGVFQNNTLLPFFDLPFAPLFLGVMFLIHPSLGLLGLSGAGLIFIVAIIAELSTRRSSELASSRSAQALEFAAGLDRQRSAIVAMGLAGPVFGRWAEIKAAGRGQGLRAAKRDAFFTASARSTRQILQILILGAGAALALAQQISPGAIVAASIILSRALAPIDQIVGGWRSLTQSRQAWADLQHSLADDTEPAQYTELPRPDAHLQIDRLSVVTPGRSATLIRPFSFEATGGQLIAVVGDNGSGKTTLLQTLASAWPPGSGAVSLGGRSVHEWPHADRGPYVGYVPQDVELLPATAAANIARLGALQSDAVVDAARRAGAHATILSLSDGYDTLVGPGGAHLSAGQRQLIGLARALYNDPVLLLLDEPTANLDAQTAAAVCATLRETAAHNAIVIAATHDERLIGVADIVLVVRHGAVMAAAPDQVLAVNERQTPTPLFPNTVQRTRGA